MPGVWLYLPWLFLRLGRTVIHPKWPPPPPPPNFLPLLHFSLQVSRPVFLFLILLPRHHPLLLQALEEAPCCGGGGQFPPFPPPAAITLLSSVGFDCVPFRFTWPSSDSSIPSILASFWSLSSQASLQLTSSVPNILINRSWFSNWFFDLTISYASSLSRFQEATPSVLIASSVCRCLSSKEANFASIGAMTCFWVCVEISMKVFNKSFVFFIFSLASFSPPSKRRLIHRRKVASS